MSEHPQATKKSRAKFTIRTAALITDGKRMVLRRLGDGDQWVLPGGIVDIGEDSETALHHKMIKDLGQNIEIECLLWVIENRYEEAGQRYHEIGLYYLAHLLNGSTWLNEPGPFCFSLEGSEEPSRQLEFRWFPYHATQPSTVQILPEFLMQPLGTLAGFEKCGGKIGAKIWGVSGTIKIKA